MRNAITCSVPSPLSGSPPDSFILKINYMARALNEFSISSLRTSVYLVFNSDPVKQFIPTTRPIQLYPGFHLFGTTFYSLKDIFASRSDLALGIPRVRSPNLFQSFLSTRFTNLQVRQFNRELIPNVQALIPDPEFTNLLTDNNTATLRLTYAGGSQYWYDLQRQQTSNTVLSGFAVLGGAWTFVSGVFAMIFGCKLLLILFGKHHFFGCGFTVADEDFEYRDETVINIWTHSHVSTSEVPR
jgi:hypothetical protein